MKWAIAPLPWAVTNSGTLWPDGLREARVSKNKDAAWEYVKFLCSPEVMRMMASDPKSQRRGSAVARQSVFTDTLGQEVGKITGMKAQDVFKVHAQADEVGIVKEHETICLHTDLSRQYIEPVLADFWANKIGPNQINKALDDRARKGMALLFQRWMRNVKYTGVQL
jgi:ABC-type glycerol-3-phosphate transport system substrate-binding protein